MALSELVRDNENGWCEVAAMGGAWAAMAALPIGAAAILSGAVLWVAIAAWLTGLGVVMSRENRAWVKTFGSLGAVAVLTVISAVLT
jgi:hypothetical protein